MQVVGTPYRAYMGPGYRLWMASACLRSQYAQIDRDESLLRASFRRSERRSWAATLVTSLD